MSSVGLSLEDINELIKHFALQIQLRIDELHKQRGLFFMHSDSHLPQQNNHAMSQILNKYSNFYSSEALQVKIIKKFTERVMQIFQFFKQKYTSHSQNLLTVIENRIKSKLQFLVNKESIPIGQVLLFAYSLTTKNALKSILKFNSFNKQKGPKPKKSFLSSCSTSVKISLYSQPEENLQPPELIERRRNQNRTELSKTQVTKNQLNFERNKDRQNFLQSQTANGQQQRPFTSKQNRVRYKRSESSSNEIRNWRKHSITNKKPDSYLKVIYKEKQNNQTTEQIVKKPVEMDKLYISMNLDRRYIEKMLERKQFLFKDMQRRNERILNKMRRQIKKQRLETEKNVSKQNDQINPVKPQFQQRSSSHLKLLTEHNGNIMSSGINKKLSFRNMIYQNHLEKKKKCLQKKNVYKNSMSKQQRISNKQNVFVDV